MDQTIIDRRSFLTATGTLVVAETPRPAGQPSAPPSANPASVTPGLVQIQLPESGFTCSRQEGGKGVMAGTFTPKAKQVVVDVEIAATFGGWCGGYFDSHIGVLPPNPPAQLEPGSNNRLAFLNNESRTPLPGVAEYHHYPLGLVSANVVGARTRHTMVFDDLTVDRVYQWELRAGELSFFKLCTLRQDSQPMALAVTPDNLYVWVACEGNKSLALMQLGWSELWPLYGYSQEMLCPELWRPPARRFSRVMAAWYFPTPLRN
jgi:hypothetical protein